MCAHNDKYGRCTFDSIRRLPNQYCCSKDNSLSPKLRLSREARADSEHLLRSNKISGTLFVDEGCEVENPLRVMRLALWEHTVSLSLVLVWPETLHRRLVRQ